MLRCELSHIVVVVAPCFVSAHSAATTVVVLTASAGVVLMCLEVDGGSWRRQGLSHTGSWARGR